jgi:hypothetical protein
MGESARERRTRVVEANIMRRDGRNAPPNNGMHPTADTTILMLRETLGAAGDAGR